MTPPGLQLSKLIYKKIAFTTCAFNFNGLRPYTEAAAAAAEGAKTALLKRVVDAEAAAAAAGTAFHSFNLQLDFFKPFVVPEPAEGIPVHNSKMIESS